MSLNRRHLLPLVAHTQHRAAPEDPMDARAAGPDRRALLSSGARGLVASMTLGKLASAASARAALRTSPVRWRR